MPCRGVVTLSKRRREAGLLCGTSSGLDDLAPRAHRRGTKRAVRLGRGEMALDVKGVVDGGVRGEKFLRRTRTLEPLHLALPPSRRLMRILGPIVPPSPALVAVLDPKNSVWVSEMDLTTLIRNLVDNAIRYTPDGGRVDLSVSTTCDTIVLTVKDTGPGIPEAEYDRVFDPFYRSLGGDQAGSGLGLSIVKAISDRIGAEVRLAPSNPDTQSGLCVAVLIPMRRALPGIGGAGSDSVHRQQAAETRS